MDNKQHWFFAIIGMIVGLATLSVILSKQAATGDVINAGSKGLSDVLKAALSPVSGGGLTGLNTGLQLPSSLDLAMTGVYQ